MNSVKPQPYKGGRYLVYPDGRVWSSYLGWFMKPFFCQSRYGRLNISGKNEYVHRLVAKFFVPNPNKLPQVNHKDGDPHNNHYANLEWTTPVGNIRHAFANGLIDRRGEKNAHSWLTAEAVLLMRELVEVGHPQKQVAAWFGLCSPAVCEIVSKKRWGHV